MEIQDVETNLFSVPIVGKFLKQIETDGLKYGWPEAIRRAGKRIGITFTSIYPTKEAEDVLNHEGVLLIGNHPFEIEVLALIGSLQERKDGYVVGNANFATVMKAATDHIIPVYISHHQSDMYNKTWLRNQMDRYHTFLPPLPKDEEHKRNVDSIAKAAKTISDGHLVMIFPDRHAVSGHWFNGVGYLTKQINLDKNPKVVFSFIEGTTSRDIWRLFPLVRKLLPPIQITFSEPQEINGLTDLQPKVITKELESRYRKWCQSIEKEYVING